MAEFKLSAIVGVSIYTTIQADSLEEAIAAAERRHIEMADNSDTDIQAQYCWVCDEFDGTPHTIHLT